MIELWKIFIETFSTLENMSRVFMITKGFMFFVAQLFSIFLLHAQLFQANIPSNIYSQFASLVEQTCAEVKKIVASLMETDAKFVPSQRSVLLLSYAIGEVKLAYNAYYEKALEDMSERVMSEEPFDFSILHGYLDKNYSSTFEIFIKNDDKILSSLVFQLFLQKVKAIQFKELSVEKTSHVQDCISVILKYLQDSISGCSSWDMDICGIDSRNFGTAYWVMFFKVSPLMLNHLSLKDFYAFCNTAQSVILQDDSSENGAKSIILAMLRSEFFQESKLFQTAFVSTLWKQENLISSKKRSYDDIESGQNPIEAIFSLLNTYHSKALKHAQRTPKSNKNLGSMWSEIREISDLLNQMLVSESLPKGKLMIGKTNELIKLLQCLPLGYLLPGNQMKCIIGLSVLFFLVPQSCNSSEIATVARDISQLLLSIFEGVRSIWLFDFVSSGPYLKYVVKTMESVINAQSEEHKWFIQFMDYLVYLIVKNVESLVPVESYIAELAVKNKFSRADLITFHTLLKKFSQVLLRPHKQSAYQEKVVKISSATIHAFLKQMKNNFNEDTESCDQSYFMKCYVEVIEIVCSCAEMEHIRKECFESFPTILEKAVKEVESLSTDACGDLYLLFISKVCKHLDKLSAFLSENFIAEARKITLSHLEQKIKKKSASFFANQSLKHPSSEFCEFCSSDSKKTLEEDSDKSRHEDKREMVPLTLTELEANGLREILSLTTIDVVLGDLKNLTQKMLAGDREERNFYFIQMCMILFKCIMVANSEKGYSSPFSELLNEFLTNLTLVANKSCNSLVCQTMIKVPVLEFVNFVIKGNKGLPKHILLQSFHCVAPVSLVVTNNDYRLFVGSFNAVWNVVYDLFMHHTSIILPFPAPFLQCVAKLLKSIVKAGEVGPLSLCDADTLQKVQSSAQNMNRLLTVITRHKNEFSKLVPYLVTYYVDTVQHITLDSSIKECILSGIHRLLDITSEDSIKMQARNINSISREVFENLVKNYRKNKLKQV